jgi:adenylate cyclase
MNARNQALDEMLLAAPEPVFLDAPAPQTMAAPSRYSVSLRAGIGATVLAVMLLTAALVYVPWAVVSRHNIADIVESLNQEIVKGIAQEIDSELNHATDTLRLIQSMLEKDIVRLEDTQNRKNLFLSMLRDNPTFSWVSFGWPNGNFTGAQRQDENQIRHVFSRWLPAQKKAVRDIDYYKVADGKLQFDVSRVLENDYYAPQRSWFRKAVDTRGVIWTDVYVFDTSRKPGLNAAISLERKGGFDGVLSIAIELERLSSYLKNVSAGKTGVAFIMTTNRSLIAFQDPAEVTLTVAGEEVPRLRRLDEATNPQLRIAASALAASGLAIGALQGMQQITYRDPDSGGTFFVSFSPIRHENWVVGTVIPENDYLATINRNLHLTVATVLLLILLAAVAAVVLSKRLLAEPLSKITAQAAHIQRFELDQIRYVPSMIREVDQLSRSVNQMRAGLSSFGKYLPTDLVRELISQGLEARLGGQEKQLTIFFSDLVNFTRIAESMPTAELIPHLSDYLGRMSGVISGERGTIDKYIGDAVMAFWGAPVANRFHAVDACRAAIKSQQVLAGLRPQWVREGRPPFFSRIGINTGPVVVGNIGSEGKMDYTVIGDSVNVASRLESLNKFYGTTIIIGHDTYEQAKQEVLVRKLDRVAVYGRDKGLDVYELLAMREEVKLADNHEWIDIYEDGLNRFQQGAFSQALAAFERVLTLRGGKDQPSALFIERCNEYLHCPPEGDFTGLTVMREK